MAPDRTAVPSPRRMPQKHLALAALVALGGLPCTASAAPYYSLHECRDGSEDTWGPAKADACCEHFNLCGGMRVSRHTSTTCSTGRGWSLQSMDFCCMETPSCATGTHLLVVCCMLLIVILAALCLYIQSKRRSTKTLRQVLPEARLDLQTESLIYREASPPSPAGLTTTQYNSPSAAGGGSSSSRASSPSRGVKVWDIRASCRNCGGTGVDFMGRRCSCEAGQALSAPPSPARSQVPAGTVFY